MKNIYFSLLIILLQPTSVYSKGIDDETQTERIEQVIKWLEKTCVSKGSESEVTAKASAEFSLKSIFTGLFGGEATLSKKEISGLSGELNKYSVDDNKDMRDCFKDFNNKLVDEYIFKGKSDQDYSPIKSNDGDFYLTLEDYDEGDIPEELGTDLVIKKMNNKNILSGMHSEPGGRVEIGNLSLKGNFTLELKIAAVGVNYILRAADGDPENDIKVSMNRNAMYFGKTSVRIPRSNFKSSLSYPNSLKIYTKKNAVKLIVNEDYFGSIKHSQEVTYGKLIVDHLGSHESIFGIYGTNR